MDIKQFIGTLLALIFAGINAYHLNSKFHAKLASVKLKIEKLDDINNLSLLHYEYPEIYLKNVIEIVSKNTKSGRENKAPTWSI